MLNKKELLDLSRQIAAMLSELSGNNDKNARGKTSDKQFLKEIFESKTSKQFVDKITDIAEKAEVESEMLRNTVEEVILMPRDNFPLFLTLIKFEYTILSKKEK